MKRFWIRLVSLIVFSLCSQANSMVFPDFSLTEQILSSFGYPDLGPGASVELRGRGELGVLGYARAFDGNIVIQLNGISQQANMGCGGMACVNALLLYDIPLYPLLQEQLTYPSFLQLAQQLEIRLVEKLREVFHESAEQECQNGLTSDMLVGVLLEMGKDIQVVCGDYRKGLGNYSQGGTFEKITPFSFPCTYIIRIGNSPVSSSHWISARFERLSDGRIGIVFVDSCPFRRDGGAVVEVVDKIEAYKNIFTDFFRQVQIPCELLPYFPPRREIVDLNEQIKIHLANLINSIVSGLGERAVNDYLRTLRQSDNRFKDVVDLSLTQCTVENDRRRIALINQIAASVPAAKETVTAMLFNLKEVYIEDCSKQELIDNTIGEIVE